MSLDERYVRGVSSLSPMFVGGNPARGPMDSAPNRVQRAFCTSTRSRSPSRILLAQDRPLSQIENRRRSHPHRWACAKRVQGLSLVVMTRLSPLRAHTGSLKQIGATAQFSPNSVPGGKKKVRVLLN
jgi:hypothetical protein